jgi:hypothetical protein
MTAEEKKPYHDMEMKEREIYYQQMGEWKKKEKLKKDMLEREVASKIKLHDTQASPELAPSQEPAPPNQEPTPPSQKPSPSQEPTPIRKPIPIHKPTPIHKPNTSMMPSHHYTMYPQTYYQPPAHAPYHYDHYDQPQTSPFGYSQTANNYYNPRQQM